MKRNEKLLMVITLVLCILLFAQRLTGDILHAVFGVLLAVIVGRHTYLEFRKMKYKKSAVRIVDCVLLAALAVLIVTGILLHPLQGVLAVKILHKLSAVVFVLGLIAHVVQHVRKRS